jgi:hypothetical protein
MIHLTMNTGHRRISRRSEVGDLVVEKMLPLTSDGSHDLGRYGNVFADYRLAVHDSEFGYHATIRHGDFCYVEIGVAYDEVSAEYAWSVMTEMYEGLFRHHAPVRPKSLPWCAAIVLRCDPCIEWAGDFERCLAWTVIQERRCRDNLQNT